MKATKVVAFMFHSFDSLLSFQHVNDHLVGWVHDQEFVVNHRVIVWPQL
jgi:hypothetical protein